MNIPRAAKYFIFSILLFSGTSLPSGTAKEYLKTGDVFFNHFDNWNALKYYEKAYEADPNSYESISKLTRGYNDLGEELLLQRKKPEAEPYINKAVELADTLLKKFPDSAESYSYKAMCLGNYALFKGGKEKVKLAIRIENNAKTALKMDPKQLLPYIILGMYYREVAGLSWVEKLFANTFFGKLPDGNYDESIQMFDKALEINPDIIITQYQLSKTYRQLGNEKKEIECLRQVLKLPQSNFRDKYLIIKTKKRLGTLVSQNSY